MEILIEKVVSAEEQSRQEANMYPDLETTPVAGIVERDMLSSHLEQGQAPYATNRRPVTARLEVDLAEYRRIEFNEFRRSPSDSNY